MEIHVLIMKGGRISQEHLGIWRRDSIPIVVHDRVHVLHPQCIDISVKHNVLPLVLVRRFVDFAENVGQESIGPVTCGGVQDAVQLDDTAVLGVDGEELGRQAQSRG